MRDEAALSARRETEGERYKRKTRERCAGGGPVVAAPRMGGE